MGLDVSHDCWTGAYSAFMRWRTALAKAAGLPPLDFMEGFYKAGDYRDPLYWAELVPGMEDGFGRLREQLPIQWECLKPSPLHGLLSHSDCEGEIAWQDCGPIADALEALLPSLPDGEGGGHIGNYRDKTSAFIAGLRLAASEEEDVEFG